MPPREAGTDSLIRRLGRRWYGARVVQAGAITRLASIPKLPPLSKRSSLNKLPKMLGETFS